MRFSNAEFRVSLLRRLRLPLLSTQARCEGCGKHMDKYGDRHVSCMRTGRVQARAKPIERAWQQVLRESGASTYYQKLLRATTLPVHPTDNRRIDVLATGLPVYHGQPLFCDATIRSPLTASGAPHPRADRINGAVLVRAEKDKQTRYGDITSSGLGRLLVLGVEVGGRWNDTSIQLIAALARHKATEAPPLLRGSAQLAWSDRWWALVGVAAQKALAASLLAPCGRNLVLGVPADAPVPIDLLLDSQRWA